MGWYARPGMQGTSTAGDIKNPCSTDIQDSVQSTVIRITSGAAMKFNDDQLNDIYDRTSGYCHLCHKKLAFKNYGIIGARGAWEVEHSKPQAKGGTNHKNNLYPACISCNRSKGASSTTSARAKNGKTRAPLSKAKRKSAKAENAVAGGALGAAVGSMFGPGGTVLGGLIGAVMGHKENPDK